MSNENEDIPFSDPDNPYSELDMDTLLAVELEYAQQIEQIESQRGMVLDAIGMWMHRQRAEVYDGERVTVTFTGKRQWIPDGMLEQQLREHMTDDEWETILNAPPKPKPRTIDKRKLPALAKRGGAFRDIIESAQYEGPAMLEINRK